MTDVQFSELELDPRIAKAVEEMGFTTATPVQAQVIPLIRGGADVIAKSQTGTGKTAGFAIPALEVVDAKEDKPTVQVLILCPTRELAQQAGEQIRLLARFLPGIRLAEVYGGASMDRQFIQLRRANMVVGTPGRVMDHMSRKTLKLQNLKMIVLDEADEMLNMGFKEDIETILAETPESRQTILFSATMPPAIRALAKTFQRDPQSVEINKSQATLEQIDQSCVEAPLQQKKEALNLLLRYHQPRRAVIFCNTKRLVDELSEYLTHSGFRAEGIHGDMKQVQRTQVMNGFKQGRVPILIATDVAARGIDVSDVDYVINYDIPLNTEYYIHRIGRTGRAGKSGRSITLFSGKRQRLNLQALAREIKSEIRQDNLPKPAEIRVREQQRHAATVTDALDAGVGADYGGMVESLKAQGYDPEQIAAAALAMCFPERALPAEISGPANRAKRREEVRQGNPSAPLSFTDVLMDVGSADQVGAKHLVGAITERAGISGREIGKIDISPDHSVVQVAAGSADSVVESMTGCKICGKVTHASLLVEKPHGKARPVHAATKAHPFADRRVTARRLTQGSDPIRRKKKKLPDFEG